MVVISGGEQEDVDGVNVSTEAGGDVVSGETMVVEEAEGLAQAASAIF